MRNVCLHQVQAGRCQICFFIVSFTLSFFSLRVQPRQLFNFCTITSGITSKDATRQYKGRVLGKVIQPRTSPPKICKILQTGGRYGVAGLSRWTSRVPACRPATQGAPRSRVAADLAATLPPTTRVAPLPRRTRIRIRMRLRRRRRMQSGLDAK